jgi:hypothetical protein
VRTLCLLLALSVGCKATAPPGPPPGHPGARPRAFARFDQPVYRPNDCVRLAVSLVGDAVPAPLAPRAEIAAGLPGQTATSRLTVPLVTDGAGRYALASCLPLNAAASGTAGLDAPPGARLGALVLGIDGAPLAVALAAVRAAAAAASSGSPPARRCPGPASES